MAVSYEWATNARMGADAQAVGEAIEEIASRHGGVCPKEALVEAARSPKHPAHKLFEWDDSVAAMRHRNDQARKILRTLVIIVQQDQVPAHVKVSITDDEGRAHEGFMRTDKAMVIPDARSGVLDRAISQLRGVQRRFSLLNETLGPVWAALDEIDPPS